MKSKHKRIRLTVRSFADIEAEILERDRKLRAGAEIESVVPELSFADLSTFLSTFTTKRAELLSFLHSCGPTTIRQLAVRLQRDFKNTHTDVQLLKRLDLIKEDKERKIYVPWDEVDVDIHIDLRHAASAA